VDRELVPSAIVDTASHLDALTASIREHGVQGPLRLSFNSNFGFLDGNHRIAVARRLGRREVPVEVIPELPNLRREHGRPMQRQDLAVLVAALEPGRVK
jgi:ParB-like chromosome segregation protein Spo0J